VNGLVYSDKDNTPIQGAVVQLCDASGNLVEERRTRSLGEFGFPGIQPGGYTLRLSADGYEPAQFTPNYRLVSNQAFTLFMKPTSPDSPRPVVTPAVSAHELSMPRSARELYASGMNKLYREKNAAGAMQDFQKALQKAPEYYEAQFQIGMAYLSLGNGEGAEAGFRKSILISSDKYSEANVALGVHLLGRGEVAEAKTQLNRALELNPSTWVACYKLGDIAYREDHLTEAEKLVSKAKELQPKIAGVYLLLAQIHKKQENYAAAVQDLDSCLELDPNNENAGGIKELREEMQRLIVQK
jgi:tetratricopeptide (TPR) repeat protein